MNKYLKPIGTGIVIIAAIVAIIGSFTDLRTKKAIIEIRTLASDKLTDLPSIDGLKATFHYKGDTVNSLWRLHCLIGNVGNETIIGEGDKKALIKDNVKFFLDANFKILEIENKNNENLFSISAKDNFINVSFLQWKPKENFELVLYVEQLSKGEEPTLKTNEREIINCEVKHTTVLDYREERPPKPILLEAQYGSKEWWFHILMYSIVSITALIYVYFMIIKSNKEKIDGVNDSQLKKEVIEEFIKYMESSNSKIPSGLSGYPQHEYPSGNITKADN
jgi:hypothetical protein